MLYNSRLSFIQSAMTNHKFQKSRGIAQKSKYQEALHAIYHVSITNQCDGVKYLVHLHYTNICFACSYLVCMVPTQTRNKFRVIFPPGHSLAMLGY